MKVQLAIDPAGTESLHYAGVNNPRGKIDLSIQTAYESHRCGWDYAIDALIPEHNGQGVLLDGFADRTFNLNAKSDWRSDFPFAPQIPYDQPWVGFFHCPPSMPAWFPDEPRIPEIIKSEKFVASMPHCRGLFTLSEYLANYLRNELHVPVSSLLFATETPEVCFDFASFLSNQEKKIVAIGWWLRKQMSISYLPLDRNSPFRKLRLGAMNTNVGETMRGLQRIEFVREIRIRGRLEERFKENTETIAYLPNDEYDRLLSENIVFLDMFDASANNIVVECIARGTPLLANPLPAVVEYLGKDYPFYFNSLDEAAEKACDFDLIKQTHEYLLTCETRPKLTQDYFLSSFRNSEVYQSLPSATA